MIRRFCIATLLSCSIAIGQSSAPATAATSTRPLAFDVATIKPAKPGENWHFGFSPVGYSAAGMTLSTVIVQAYFPFNAADRNAIVGAPDWVGKDLWDIETKVAPEDLDAYKQNRTSMYQRTDSPGQLMLQHMLADRCKLVAHRVPAEMDGYFLTLDKHDAKLTPAPPDEPRPDHGQPMPDGGYLVPYQRGDVPHVSFYGVTIAELAVHLRGMGGGIIVDRTGLTGRYDFTLTWLSSGPEETHVGAISSDDPDPLSHWNFAALGLRAERAKVPTTHLVIDHVERPSEN